MKRVGRTQSYILLFLPHNSEPVTPPKLYMERVEVKSHTFTTEEAPLLVLQDQLSIVDIYHIGYRAEQMKLF